MRVIDRIAVAGWFLIALFGASTAHGNGECAKGIRDVTAAERETITAVLEAVRKALPPAPAGWVIEGDGGFSVPKSLCRDVELAPWRYGFGRSYRRVDDQASRDALMKKAAAEMQADMKRMQPHQDKLMARMKAITAKQVEAIKKGDHAAAIAMNKEIAALQAEYQKIYEQGGAKTRTEALLQQASRDLSMHISVRVNPPQEGHDDRAANFKLPPGAASAFRWTQTREGVDTDQILVLMGQWKPGEKGGWQLVPRASRAATTAHGISIQVAADPGRVTSMVDAIDFKALGNTLTR